MRTRPTHYVTLKTGTTTTTACSRDAAKRGLHITTNTNAVTCRACLRAASLHARAQMPQAAAPTDAFAPYTDAQGHQHAFCACGADCSTHPDAAHPLDYCADCGRATCDEHRDYQEIATVCIDCLHARALREMRERAAAAIAAAAADEPEPTPVDELDQQLVREPMPPSEADWTRAERAVGQMQLVQTELLAAAARGELDLNRIARIELASRGLDWQGRWVGFERAKFLSTCCPVRRADGSVVPVSIPSNGGAR